MIALTVTAAARSSSENKSLAHPCQRGQPADERQPGRHVTMAELRGTALISHDHERTRTSSHTNGWPRRRVNRVLRPLTSSAATRGRARACCSELSELTRSGARRCRKTLPGARPTSRKAPESAWSASGDLSRATCALMATWLRPLWIAA
jgi:hypothetical protein